MYPKIKIIFSAILIFGLFYFFFKPSDISYKTQEANSVVTGLLKKFKVSESSLLKETHEFKKTRRCRFQTISRTYVVGLDFPFEAFKNELKKSLSKNKLYVSAWERNVKEAFFRIDIGFKNKKIYVLILRGVKREARKEPVFKKAKVAIVIDDFGYGISDIQSWLTFARPITFSVLPNLNYSTRISRLANAYGKEVILHLPLEPHHEENQPQEQFTITTTIPEPQVLKILGKAIASITHLKGISNHQGSRATEDVNLMRIIFSELKKRNLFFLDSLVTPKSVCQDLALQTGIRFVQRDVFLDNINEVEEIKKQLNKLADVAQQRGFAIGIGHDRPKTIEALQSSYRDLEARGIEFVYLSELVK
jgi:polysaccharide deacetylase 2 family uncharacterized protein YibQ